ncbi:TPA: hypothetical protein ACPUF2_001685 [Klebsiella pneumoniae]
MKYFNIDSTVLMLLNGEVARHQIRSLRNSSKKQGYAERAAFFTEVLERYDALCKSRTK